MRLPRSRLADLLLAVVCLSLFCAVVEATWGTRFVLVGSVMTGVILFPTYLVLLLMLRHHRRSEKKPEEKWLEEL
jgi:hypothetical protein